MPKSKVSDPITDQEIAFARLILSGAMTDRRAAESVGLNPGSAANTKAKPRVRAYLLEHRAAVQQQAVQQEVEGLRRFNLDREQVLARLWQIANLGPEMTRGSITGQVKALSIIAAMQNFIPDRRAVSAEKNPAPAPVNAQIYQSAWLRKQQADPQPSTAPTQEEDSPEVSEPNLAPGSIGEAPPDPVPTLPTFAHRVPLADGRPPYVPLSTSVPDLRIPFSIKKNPFTPFNRRPR
jgi:hypothetical protein